MLLCFVFLILRNNSASNCVLWKKGPRSLWEAPLPGALSSHAAHPDAPGRGALPARRHGRQYLRGSRRTPRAVHPRECKITTHILCNALESVWTPGRSGTTAVEAKGDRAKEMKKSKYTEPQVLALYQHGWSIATLVKSWLEHSCFEQIFTKIKDWIHSLHYKLLFFVNVDIWLCFLQDGTDAVVKDVLPGDSVHSLLSVLDIITARFHLRLWHTCIFKRVILAMDFLLMCLCLSTVLCVII